jgi:hypothetical protein
MGAPSSICFHSTHQFLYFDSEYQITFHNQLFDLLWAGEGRWSFQDIYELPLRIRKLWISRVNKIYQNSQKSDTTSQISKPPRRTPY